MANSTHTYKIIRLWGVSSVIVKKHKMSIFFDKDLKNKNIGIQYIV